MRLSADPSLITFGHGTPFGVRMLSGQDSQVPLVGLVSPRGEDAVLEAAARSVAIDDGQFVLRALAGACGAPMTPPGTAPAYSLPDPQVSWTITATVRNDLGTLADSSEHGTTTALLPASLGPGAHLVQVGSASPEVSSRDSGAALPDSSADDAPTGFSAAAELPVLIADRRLAATRDAGGLTVTITGADGNPRSDVVIDALDCGGGILTRGQPGQDGVASLAAPGIHLSRMIVARRDGRIVGAAYLPRGGAPGSPGAKYRVLLERALPTYRPGETLRFHAYVLENGPEGLVPAPRVPVWFGFSETRPEVAALTDAYGVASASVVLPPATGAPGPLVITVDGEPHHMDIGGRVPGSGGTLTFTSDEPVVSLSRDNYAVSESLTAAIRGHDDMAVSLVTLCLGLQRGPATDSAIGEEPAADAVALAWRHCGDDVPYALQGPLTPVQIEVGPIRAFEREAADRMGVVRRMLAVMDEGEDSRRILAPGAVYEVREPSAPVSLPDGTLSVTARTTGPLTSSMPITFTVRDAAGIPVEAGVYILISDARVRGAFPGADRLADALAGFARESGTAVSSDGAPQTFPWDRTVASASIVDLDQGVDRRSEGTSTVVGPSGESAVLLKMPSTSQPWWIRVTAVTPDGRVGGTDLVVR